MYETIPQMQKEADNYIDIFNNFEDELYELQSKIYSLYEENVTLKKKFEDNDEKFKDINIKLQDLNIVDMLKGNSGDGGDMNITLGLISNLEKKTLAKNKLIDEKISKIDSSMFKVEKESQNIKNSQNLNKRQIDQIKKQIEEMNKREENIYKTIETNNEDLNDKIESKVNYLEKYIKESIDKIKKELKNNLSKINENIINGKESSKNLISANEFQNMNIENNQAIKSLKEAMIEINKKIKTIINQNDLEQIKSDISALKSGMSNYTLLPDFKEVKDTADENKVNIRRMREDFEDFQNTQTENTEIVNIKRKLELVTNKVHDMAENNTNKNNKNNNKLSVDDKNKFIEYKIFDEFKLHIAKEFNNINDNFINSRKLLDELIDSVRNRTSFKDLKALEDALLSKMDDLKISSSKKYSEKNEVNRAIKYLDQQIRNIVQIYIKKIEKGENWLLSKKPITSNLCASCESYIGDLKDINNNNIYVPWNKYPVKDANDKLYRMGDGYSKMLQMIQIDENDKKNVNNENNEFSKTKTLNKAEYLNTLDISDFSGKKINTIMNRTTQKSLPKIKKNRLKKKANTAGDSENNNKLMNMNNEDSDDNEDEPKITKIFKKNKEQH